MANVYVTADAHFGHARILMHCNRAFLSLQHMNAVMIQNWNDRVGSDDTIWHLGDFCFKGSQRNGNGMRLTAGEWEGKLSGHIYHVRGNHDTTNGLKHAPEYAVLKFGGKVILLIHDPAVLPVCAGVDMVICGHSHNAWKMRIDRNTGLPVYNAGVDVNDFKPVSVRSVIKQLSAYEKRQKRLRAKEEHIEDTVDE